MEQPLMAKFENGILIDHTGRERWSKIVLELAGEAARMALEADRANRKMGRQDRGTGSDRVGQYIQKNRADYGMSQRELAKKAGLHPTTIGKIETGERGMSLETFCKLANILGEDFVWDIIDEIAPVDE